MVFRDFEIIPTIRVNKRRSFADPWRRHFFYASGGWYSVYLQGVSICSVLFYLSEYKKINLYELFPMEKIKRPTYRMIGAHIFGAMLFGAAIGTVFFSDLGELVNLTINYNVYKKEMLEYRKALYSK